MDPNAATRLATGSLSGSLYHYDLVMRRLSLLAIHCRLQMAMVFMNDQDCAPEDIDPEVLRVIAHLLADMGKTIDDIEACVAHDIREGVIPAASDEEHVTKVMSLFFDVREVADDFLV
ncbi:uncharacterized protein PG986_001942 [Apiospora aurea]|uniref:Uncharacterized protein n=1 Tax=Apiospora aurea TaxID=335848 RepID=A0ABR1R029_9PEZI